MLKPAGWNICNPNQSFESYAVTRASSSWERDILLCFFLLHPFNKEPVVYCVLDQCHYAIYSSACSCCPVWAFATRKRIRLPQHSVIFYHHLPLLLYSVTAIRVVLTVLNASIACCLVSNACISPTVAIVGSVSVHLDLEVTTAESHVTYINISIYFHIPLTYWILVCGALADGRQRIPREDNHCDCPEGWEGINCNGMCCIVDYPRISHHFSRFSMYHGFSLWSTCTHRPKWYLLSRWIDRLWKPSNV